MSRMTPGESRLIARVFTINAVVCLAATAWMVCDLLTHPYSGYSLTAVLIGVAVTAAIASAGRWYWKRGAK